MRGTLKHAALLVLIVGLAAPAHLAWAEAPFEIEGVEGEARSLPLRSFPVGTFSGLHHLQFQQQDIVTAGDLIDADPELIGRIMGMDRDEIEEMQRYLSEVMVDG